MTPGPLSAAILAAPAGRWAQRYGHERVIVPGLALFTLGIGLLILRTDARADYFGTYLPAILLTGSGIGLAISTLGSASNAYLPPDRFAMGSAFNATARQVGAALGIAVVAAVRAATSDPTTAFHRSWSFIAACAVVAGVVMATVYRRPTPLEVVASDTTGRPPTLIAPVAAEG